MVAVGVRGTGAIVTGAIVVSLMMKSMMSLDSSDCSMETRDSCVGHCHCRAGTYLAVSAGAVVGIVRHDEV